MPGLILDAPPEDYLLGRVRRVCLTIPVEHESERPAEQVHQDSSFGPTCPALDDPPVDETGAFQTQGAPVGQSSRAEDVV